MEAPNSIAPSNPWILEEQKKPFTDPEVKKISIYMHDVVKAATLTQSVGMAPIFKAQLPDKSFVHIVIDPLLQKKFEEQHRYGPEDKTKLRHTQFFTSEGVRDKLQAVFPKENLLTTFEEDSKIIRQSIFKFFNPKNLDHLRNVWQGIAEDWAFEMVKSEKVLLFEATSQLVARFLIEGLLGYRRNSEEAVRINTTLWKTLLDPLPTQMHDVDSLPMGFFSWCKEQVFNGLSMCQKVIAYKRELSQFREIVKEIIKYGCSEEGRQNPNLCAHLANTMSSELLEGTIEIFMLAGQETASYLLGYILYQYAAQPDLFNEHAADIKKEQFADMKTKSKMQDYLFYKAYQEGLRMYPTGGTGRKVALDLVVKNSQGMPEGMPAEYTIRKGERINCIPFVAGRNPALWKDPEVFNPARPELENVLEKTVSFASGANSCPGRMAAELEIFVALYTILSMVTVEKVEDLPPLIDANVIRPEKDIPITFSMATL